MSEEVGALSWGKAGQRVSYVAQTFQNRLRGQDNPATPLLKDGDYFLKQSDRLDILSDRFKRHADKARACGRRAVERLGDHFVAELGPVFMRHMDQPSAAIVLVECEAAVLALAPTHTRGKIIRQIGPGRANDALIDTRRPRMNAFPSPFCLSSAMAFSA